MRRLAPLLLAAALVPAATAWADEQITASPFNTYDNPDVTIDQGERLTFRNTDVNSHDVTADQPGEVNGFLFQSELVGNGESSFVEGSQHLTTGRYTFACSIHPEMKGTITVTTAGTPVPRGGGEGGDTTTPVVQIDAPAKARASKLRRTRRLKVTVTSSEGASAELTARVGTRQVGKAKGELATGETSLTVRITRKGAKRLKKGRRLNVAVTASDAADHIGRADVDVRLR